ncbi:MAG: thioredoxin family protein, partial [Parachlamydiaceae bacterium]|nr:thioredoxin family protein [Parachlamydiaceae bacterium]
SPELIAQLQKEGKPFLIDFTAKWCLICQANHFILESSDVDQKVKETGVVKIVADWTKNDPSITKELAKYGRNSVPLYVLYEGKKDKDPVLLPQVLTSDVVIDHLNKIL